MDKITTLTRWQSVWQQLGGRESGELLHRLVACYAEPHRTYHTMQHLEECFALLEKVSSLAERVGEIELALWFHDAVYDTHKHDNEKLSAEWARDSALEAGLSTEQADRVFELVLATRHNAVPIGNDAQILVDIDLGILGAETARFDEYEVQVREEYSWVPGFLYRRERRKILEQFATRPTIYNTEYFRAEYEATARENLARSLARL